MGLQQVAFQGFSSQLHLAKKLASAKRSSPVLSEEQKAHRKQLRLARDEKLRAENLAQRALIESKRGEGQCTRLHCDGSNS